MDIVLVTAVAMVMSVAVVAMMEVEILLFRCVLASLYEGLSVLWSVRPSIRRSVRQMVPCYF